MKLRVARHTSDIHSIITFYQDVMGMENLGSFKNHKKYDGVFLGWKNESWHLEFTVSDEKPDHKADEDDLLVFYARTKEEYDLYREKLKVAGVQHIASKNPYWDDHGITFLDPDGFRIVLSTMAMDNP